MPPMGGEFSPSGDFPQGGIDEDDEDDEDENARAGESWFAGGERRYVVFHFSSIAR